MAIVVIMCAVLYLYSLLPTGYELRSLSYVGAIGNNQLVFATSLLAAGVLMYIFFSQYVEMNFKTSLLFRLFYIIAVVSQVLVALVPISSTTTFVPIVHWLAAVCLGVSMIGVMFVFAKDVTAEELPVDIQSKTVMLVSLLVVAANIYAVFFTSSFTFTQALAAAVFWYWIIRVTFLRINNPPSF